MNLPQCAKGTGIQEGELHDAAMQRRVRRIRVMETPDGFYVVVELRSFADGEGVAEWFLCTRRNQKRPKLFSRLERLNTRLKEMCPGVGFELFRTRPEQKKKPVKSG